MKHNNKFLLKKEKNNYWIVFFLLFIFSFLYFHNLAGWLVNDDEGWYFYQSWRMSEGEIPYKDFYTPKEPIFLFTGSLIMKLFGQEVFRVRLFTVIVTLLTGYLIFLLGKKLFDYKVGIFGLLSYLILPVVYFQARLYRSDAYMVFFSTLGLFFYIKAWLDNKKVFFLWSGVSFAVSVGYKLFGIFGLLGLVVFIIYQSFMEKRFSFTRYTLFLLSVGFFGLIIPFFIIISNIAPEFLSCIVGHHTRQPLYSHLIILIIRNFKDLFLFDPGNCYSRDRHIWIIIIAFPLLLKYLFQKNEPRKIISFYILSGFIILLHPYTGETNRYLLYLLPLSILLSINFIFYLYRLKDILKKLCAFVILVAVFIKIFIPGLRHDYVLFSAKEKDTLALAQYISKNTSKEDYVLTDYGELLFHAKRKTTPLTSAVSKSAIDNGLITSDKLIKEINKYQVKMIIIHTQGTIAQDLSFAFGALFEPTHLKSLITSSDGSKFIKYLNANYHLINQFQRTGQIFDIYIRNKM